MKIAARTPVRYSCIELLEARIAPATFTVTNLDDNLLAGSLRKAINDANLTPAPDSIVFAGVLGTLTLDTALGALLITAPLTIKGPGVDVLKISGSDTIRVFNINDSDPAKESPVAISGLSVINGKSATNGGGIVSSETLTLNNVVIASSSAALSGGGVYMTGSGKVSITGCKFLENFLSTATSLYGGGLSIDTTGDIVLKNTLFSHNFAVGNSSTYGGGAYLRGDHSVAVSDSTFTGNVADKGGAGLLCETRIGRLMTVKNTSFIANASELGSGLYRFKGALAVTGSNFSSNVSTFGALYLEANSTGKTTIAKTIFANNYGKTATSQGGAIFQETNSDELNISGSQFVGNFSTVAGGAIASYGQLKLSTTLFAGNTSRQGGALYTNGSVVSKGSTFLGNRAFDGFNGRGGAIFAGAAAGLAITSGSFLDNASDNYGGAIYTQQNSAAVLAVTGTLFQGNKSQDGGAIAFSAASNATIKGARFIQNVSDLQGGALDIATTGAVAISGSLFRGNASIFSDGGAIRITTGNVNLSGSTFVENFAYSNLSYGGAIDIRGGAVVMSKLKIMGNGAGTGGGIYNIVAGTILTSSTVTGNFAVNGPNLSGI